MTRVMVIGNAGGGKSTLCRAIAARHDLPWLAIDQIQWQPGWVRTPEERFQADHASWLGGDRWLIDGYGSWKSVLLRLRAADTIILVDHPFRVHLWWAVKRQVRSILMGRPDGPPGCPMWPVTFRLFQMMCWLDRIMRPRLLRAVYRRADRARIIHIRSPEELSAFAENPV